jgi:hypothetical protein
MSKTENPLQIKPNTPEINSEHLKTTERGLSLARAALAEAQARAIAAEETHRANLERVLAEERAVIKALRVEMYGEAAEKAMQEVEAWESQVIAEAEEALEEGPQNV